MLTDKAPGELGTLNTQRYLFKGKDVYLTRKLGVDMINSLVTFALFVWPKTTPDPPLDNYLAFVSSANL